MIRNALLILGFFVGLLIFALASSTSSHAKTPLLRPDANNSTIPDREPPSRLGVNARFFDDRISPTVSAVFWYGQLDATRNHTDVRIGYNPDEIQIYLNVFDKWLFYDESGNKSDIENWDSVSIYLQPAGTTTTYKLQSQLRHWQPVENYKIAYKNTGGGYVQDSSFDFDMSTQWQGEAFNSDTIADRGYYIKLNIPFSSFGLSQPANGTIWKMALVTHDRDNSSGSTINSQQWPPTADLNAPASWGELRFGRRSMPPQTVTPSGTLSLRHGVNGAVVPDTHVGGGANCGVEHDPDFFNGWSTHNFPNATQINIQNQMNVADWPCFSKYFISFDLSSIPSDREIISAELKMFMFGNAGPPGAAKGSTLQVMTLDSEWDEATANWQNSPSVIEHIAETWVLPINNGNNFADPAIEVTWDVATAVDAAHQTENMLNLAIYEADWELHSGKYFYSSDAPDDYHRPILTITYGSSEPFVPTDFIYLPLIIR